MTENTPLPWRFQVEVEVDFLSDERRTTAPIYTSEGHFACICTCGNPGDARLIVKAVNNHERLVAALRPIVTCYGLGSTPEKFCEHVHDFIMEARALLAELDT